MKTEILIHEKNKLHEFGIEINGSEEDASKFEDFCRNYFNESKKKGKDFGAFRQGRAYGWCFFETFSVKSRDELEELLDLVKKELKRKLFCETNRIIYRFRSKSSI